MTNDGWSLEKIGISKVAIDDTNMTIARKRFGPKILTATDDATCVNA